jgi:hypothetical protein
MEFLGLFLFHYLLCWIFKIVLKDKNLNSMAHNMKNTTLSLAHLPITFTSILQLLFYYYYNFWNTTGKNTSISEYEIPTDSGATDPKLFQKVCLAAGYFPSWHSFRIELKFLFVA